MSTTAKTIDYQDEAHIARVEHTRLVEALMATIDVLDDAQQGKTRLNIPNMRRAASQMMRRSAAQHSFALAALTVDAAPDCADRLCDYAEEILGAAAAPDDDGPREG